MKTKIFAITAFLLITAVVGANTLFLNHKTTYFLEELKKIDMTDESALNDTAELKNKFTKSLGFISLTVSHDDLTNIQDGFAELLGYLSVSDTDGAQVTKNRLIDSLSHLRRLSGINIDSII